ncbi:MAG TPA: growth inhibitor PemK [Gammaproteobacteria bacterium]|nr:growth inhibitor PemK [Gammaproteobacteria bacterium]
MALPVPHPGQVIRYAYLWWNEARTGREDGTKDRPCGIVLTRITTAGRTVAYVLPSTHTPPITNEDGVEIPLNTKERLGLDTERSWIITSELNQFTWPSPDLRPTAAGEYIYGYLPEKLLRLVLESVKKNAREKRLKTVPRTD